MPACPPPGARWLLSWEATFLSSQHPALRLSWHHHQTRLPSSEGAALMEQPTDLQRGHGLEGQALCSGPSAVLPCPPCQATPGSPAPLRKPCFRHIPAERPQWKRHHLALACLAVFQLGLQQDQLSRDHTLPNTQHGPPVHAPANRSHLLPAGSAFAPARVWEAQTQGILRSPGTPLPTHDARPVLHCPAARPGSRGLHSEPCSGSRLGLSL